jgi:UDP-N-acetyl-D-mannosaminuronate dehydrogenase
MQNVLIVGLGEIGGTIHSILEQNPTFRVYGIDIDKNKMKEHKAEEPPSESQTNCQIGVLHMCIPVSDKNKFIDTVKLYTKKYMPKLTIINSTVPVGTTIEIYNQCGGLIAHSPCRGVHKNREYMVREFLRWVKYVGGATPEAGKASKEHLNAAGFKTKMLANCTDTEFAKLFETTYRTWMIVFFQKMARMAERYSSLYPDFEISFDETVDFIEDTHRVRNDRPVMFPDAIGGHCLLQNSKLLLEEFEPEMLSLIIESNNERIKEMKNPGVVAETRKVRKRVSKFEDAQDEQVMSNDM